MSELDLANNQLSNNLKTLKDLHLISGDNGLFEVNSSVFWIGLDLVLKSKGKIQVTYELVDSED